MNFMKSSTLMNNDFNFFLQGAADDVNKGQGEKANLRKNEFERAKRKLLKAGTVDITNGSGSLFDEFSQKNVLSMDQSYPTKRSAS